MLGSCGKPPRRLVRVVTAPVFSSSNKAWRSARVEHQGLALLMSGGLIGGRGIARWRNQVVFVLFMKQERDKIGARQSFCLASTSLHEFDDMLDKRREITAGIPPADVQRCVHVIGKRSVKMLGA